MTGQRNEYPDTAGWIECALTDLRRAITSLPADNENRMPLSMISVTLGNMAQTLRGRNQSTPFPDTPAG